MEMWIGTNMLKCEAGGTKTIIEYEIYSRMRKRNIQSDVREVAVWLLNVFSLNLDLKVDWEKKFD